MKMDGADDKVSKSIMRPPISPQLCSRSSKASSNMNSALMSLERSI